jgi:CxxC motif-containing protein (DUF1111 family)
MEAHAAPSQRNIPCLATKVLVAAALSACGDTPQSEPTPVSTTSSVRDPGVRGDPPGAGAALAGLSSEQHAFFEAGREDFLEVSSVQGPPTMPDTELGLGPRFNLDSCAGCHSQPEIGGSSPEVNPQVAVATLHGARNAIPWFVTAEGPIREARFVRKPDGSPDGGVAALFTITGRSDAPGCSIAQPDFGTPGDPVTGLGGDPNVVFRIPTPIFGVGLIEAIPDAAVLENMRAASLEKEALGIAGHPNYSPNDGSISRFGWKAQNRSIEIFAGEAYNVEQGVTNALFPDERDQTPSCLFNPLPEDLFTHDATSGVELVSGVQKFTSFMQFLAPPARATETPSIAAGREAFAAVGCAHCHTPSLRTGRMAIAPLAGQDVELFSDLLLHRMGPELADGITQGAAGPDEFRTPPLWGLGQRVFFLHDGRTRDLLEAIRAHGSAGSEAELVVRAFEALPAEQRQALLDFLRSL